MYKSAIRAAPRRILSSRSVVPNSPIRRFLSTAPPSQKPRGWKSSAARWMLAISGIYYYNTSNVFAEEPEAAIQRLDEALSRVQESNHPTLDAIVEEKREREARRLAQENKGEAAARVAFAGEEEAEGEEGMGGLEEEADQQGAFNPETGEINWDCPCLGGMAHGPCGEEFRAAFSCFVYSNEEPKGVECIEKFKGMQDCFRQHPEMYGSELEDDEDEVEEELHAREAAASPDVSTTPPSESPKALDTSQKVTPRTSQNNPTAEEPKRDTQSTTADELQREKEDGGQLLPKASHDASSK